MAPLPRRRCLLLALLLPLLVIGVTVTSITSQAGAQSPTAAVRAVKVAAGGAHTCALTSDGAVKCWGYNGRGQVGDRTTTDRLTPVQVAGLNRGVVAISAGSLHSCAVTDRGAVKCWGDNSFGQLGDGTTTNRLLPVDVSGLGRGVADVVTGHNHTCALMTSGSVKCWGLKGGNGSLSDQLTPGDVLGLGGSVATMEAGGEHSCAVTTGGGVKCWGRNDYGALGDGTTTTSIQPVTTVGLGSGGKGITAGTAHTCAVTLGGGGKCWGLNHIGQLGDGTTTNRTTPVDVTGLGSGVAAVASSDSHTCVLSSSAFVKCWGHNGAGGIGDGTTITRTIPVDVVGLNGVTAISAGSQHSCAVTTGGGVKCWGFNGNGTLGDGTTTNRTTPVDVVGLGSTAGGTTPSGTWSQKLPPMSPAARHGAAMAFDTARGNVVLFGGCDQCPGQQAATWTWDGAAWTQHAVAGPPARVSPTMAYDAAHQRVVLFGGTICGGGCSSFGDTWTWDGTSWTEQHPATSPQGRSEASMAYDALHNSIVLFGGLDRSTSSLLNDTWAWDGTNWTQQSPITSPPGRYGASMAYDVARQNSILFGGAGGGIRNDTWAWDGTTWTQRFPTTSPSARFYLAMAHDPGSQTTLLFGGDDSNGLPLNDTWTWDGANWTQQNPTTKPSSRGRAALASDFARGAVVLFGGDDNASFFGDTWVWGSTTALTKTGTVSGLVWVDSNRNGASDTGEFPYSGATVSLSGPTTASTTTDKQGKYSFTKLPAGSYTVLLTLPMGYQSTTTTNPATVVVGPNTTVNFGLAPKECNTAAGFIFPLTGAGLTRTQPFANKLGVYNGRTYNGYHAGEDWAFDRRTANREVSAVAPGKIAKISDLTVSGLGYLIAIEHKGSFTIPGKTETIGGQTYQYHTETVIPTACEDGVK